jgi:hypothetical protein
MGKNRIIVKTDREASIVELQTEIARRRANVGTSLENSKVGDSNSNRKVECAIRDVGNTVRTLKSALSENSGMTITLAMNIVPWMVRHASYLITLPSSELREDGAAAHQGPEVAHRTCALRRGRDVQDSQDF